MAVATAAALTAAAAVAVTGDGGVTAVTRHRRPGRHLPAECRWGSHLAQRSVADLRRRALVSGAAGTATASARGDVKDDHNGVVSVRSVRLARTGFDAWVLALIGGVARLELLAGPRRGNQRPATARTDALPRSAFRRPR